MKWRLRAVPRLPSFLAFDRLSRQVQPGPGRRNRRRLLSGPTELEPGFSS